MKRNMKIVIWAIWILNFLILTGIRSGYAEVEQVSLKSLAGWIATDFEGKPPKGAVLKLGKNGIEYQYNQAVLSPLAHGVLLNNFKEIRLRLLSPKNATFLFALEDKDKASFHYVIQLLAGQPTTVTIQPKDLKLNEDSPVKKEHLDPSRLEGGYVLFDFAAVSGGKGKNRLTIMGVEIERMN